VKSHVLSTSSQSENAISAFQPYFPGMPVMRAAQSGGRTTYYGRRDISRFLASISISRIPWRTYTFAG
jgi:hypothetical protein